MNAATLGKFKVLLIDDDDVAVESVLRSFRKHEVPCPVITAGDGQEALDILRGGHGEKDISQPYLVLLDLNMPRMSGFEFLEVVRADAMLQSIVVFVLTTSARDADRLRAYAENVAGYMVKSAVGPQFFKLATLLRSYGDSVLFPG